MASLQIGVWGDSIAAGAGATNCMGWAQMLGCQFTNAVHGDGLREIQMKIQNDLQENCPPVVIIAAGINDARWIESSGEYTSSIEQTNVALNQILSLLSDKLCTPYVLGLTPVDDKRTTPVSWNSDRFWKSERVATVNEEMERICKSRNVTYISLQNQLKDNHLEDGLHPNDEGHEIIAKIVSDTLNGISLLPLDAHTHSDHVT